MTECTQPSTPSAPCPTGSSNPAAAPSVSRRGFLSGALFEAGLYCRADDRGDPVIQLAPPLTIGPSEFDEIEQILRSVLTEAWSRL